MSTPMPQWQIPPNLQSLIDADDDRTWSTEDWSPIELTVMSGTLYEGRDIELSWQLEYEPDDCDGYEFLDRVLAAVNDAAPEIADDLHCDDTEDAAFVIWAESESTCKRLLEIVWSLVDQS